jgi:ankyrin repeat protein
MTRRLSVNVGGLWRTEVELKEKATWYDLKKEIGKVTGIPLFSQKLKPNGKDKKKCELEEGDDVFCDWKLLDGYYPLHCAAEDGNIEAIRSWLASGADINVTNAFEQTPLMRACWNSKEECVTELLKLGANANAIDKYGETSLHKIAYNRNLKKMKKIAKMLIKAGCDSMMRNNNGFTIVDIAKKYRYYELANEVENWIKEASCKA